MKPLSETDVYRSGQMRKSLLARMFLSHPFTFYPQVACVIFRASIMARLGRYGHKEWLSSSSAVLRACGNVGMQCEITGLDNLRALDGPVVFVGNHMSTLETFVLPVLIGQFMPFTFVVKNSLLTYPVFGAVMRSRDPVVVGRKKPREDLMTVMEEGAKRLASGISMVIFPQSTRSIAFNPSEFNSLGVKLAARAGVPVVPVALKTDAWGNGKLLRDFGPVDPASPVRIAFGQAMSVQGRGTEEHAEIMKFISSHLREWGVTVNERQ
ncbi:MAG: 1-acyl-sn-glycerol-3-phosphate acyltransferase [Nitrospirae bacterium]|nr:1-acyl-sn-glycerol-3-phosphate acyltransferase [Nitrospirota bacterium]